MNQMQMWDYFQSEVENGDAFAGARTRYEFLAQHIAPGMWVLNVGVGRGEALTR